MTTPVEKSTNPSTNTAAQTVGATPPAPHHIATGYEGTVRDQIDHLHAAYPRRRDGHAAGARWADHYQPRVLDRHPLLLHEDQHREPDDSDRGADDAGGGADVRDHPGRNRPVGRRHGRVGHGDLHPAHECRCAGTGSPRCSSRWSSAPRSARSSASSSPGSEFRRSSSPWPCSWACRVSFSCCSATPALTASRTPAVIAIMNKSMPVWAGWLMLADHRRHLAGHRALRPRADESPAACRFVR